MFCIPSTSLPSSLVCDLSPMMLPLLVLIRSNVFISRRRAHRTQCDTKTAAARGGAKTKHPTNKTPIHDVRVVYLSPPPKALITDSIYIDGHPHRSSNGDPESTHAAHPGSRFPDHHLRRHVHVYVQRRRAQHQQRQNVSRGARDGCLSFPTKRTGPSSAWIRVPSVFG